MLWVRDTRKGSLQNNLLRESGSDRRFSVLLPLHAGSPYISVLLVVPMPDLALKQHLEIPTAGEKKLRPKYQKVSSGRNKLIYSNYSMHLK